MTTDPKQRPPKDDLASDLLIDIDETCPSEPSIVDVSPEARAARWAAMPPGERERWPAFREARLKRKNPYMPLGEPPHDDVEAAARLLLEYQRQGLTGPEFGEMFFMMVRDPRAVSARADELQRSSSRP